MTENNQPRDPDADLWTDLWTEFTKQGITVKSRHGTWNAETQRWIK